MPAPPIPSLASLLATDHQCKLQVGGEKMFSVKKWNTVAMWNWDVECDTCTICKV
ncbi:hypothetical protein A6R68_05334, partial [Neotoma lepida]